MLGCPVVFPQFINSPEDVELDGTEKSARLLDVFFYTANWFREIICAFASQRVLNIRKKVLMRLTDLISLEQNIRNLLATMPQKSNYTPPKCHFMTTEKQDLEAIRKTKAPAANKEPAGNKRKSKKATEKQPTESIPNNSTLMEGGTNNHTLGNLLQSSRVDEGTNKSKNLSTSGFYGPKEVYRQLDPDILMLLQESLCTSYPLPRDKMGTCLGLAEYQFIVEDLILKLESVTGLKKSSGFQQDQFIIFSVALITDMKQFLERFMQFFNQFSDAIKRNQELQANESSDACLYTDEMNQLKRCFGLTMRLYAALFSWQGFHQEKHQKLFKSKGFCFF